MAPEVVRNAEEGVLKQRNSQRVFELDALRGIAAFSVIWHHLREALPGDPLHHQLFYPLFAGHQAVVLFFVLSGFVLAIPFWKSRQLSYARYLIRRITRIYFPYLAALIVAWLCASHLLFSRLPLTTWFYRTWQTPLTGALFVNQLLMSTSPELNTAFWSLHYEVIMSILFPFLCLGVSKLPPKVDYCVVGALAIIGFVSTKEIAYPAFFMFGALLCRDQKITSDWYSHLNVRSRIFIYIASLVLYYTKIPEGWRYGPSLQDVVTAAGSAGLIILALNAGAMRKFLRTPLFEYLGRISYSLYLLHGTILFVLLNLLYGHVRLAIITILFGVLSVLTAHLFCITIEEPCMRLGKRLTS
jgi:peptidoglycan/LPS O-acetylase OafA/YrhL